MIGLTLFLILVYMLLFIACLMFISYLHDKFKIDFGLFILGFILALVVLKEGSAITAIAILILNLVIYLHDKFKKK
jgi:hypothetical protein